MISYSNMFKFNLTHDHFSFHFILSFHLVRERVGWGSSEMDDTHTLTDLNITLEQKHCQCLRDDNCVHLWFSPLPLRLLCLLPFIWSVINMASLPSGGEDLSRCKPTWPGGQLINTLCDPHRRDIHFTSALSLTPGSHASSWGPPPSLQTTSYIHVPVQFFFVWVLHVITA